MTTLERYKEIINDFDSVSIGVIGDIIADISIYGRPYKLSREAPVIVVKHESESIMPGGAGNTVNNISKLDARVYPICLIGDDNAGKALLDYFSNDRNVDTNGLFICHGSNTITKTRILAGDIHTTKQQVIRIDKEPTFAITKELEDRIIAHIEDINKKVQVWAVSDYGYNIITKLVLEKIKECAKEKIVIVDSRNRLRDFSGVTIIAPNESEAEAASGIRIDENNSIYKIGEKLLKEIAAEVVLITRGNHGMTLFEKNGNVEDIPICGPKEVTDVTGAGDTVISILAVAFAAGATPYQAARLSNYGAGIVVMKRGTATLSRPELIEIIERDLTKRE